jgi:hypothetical protein
MFVVTEITVAFIALCIQIQLAAICAKQLRHNMSVLVLLFAMAITTISCLTNIGTLSFYLVDSSIYIDYSGDVTRQTAISNQFHHLYSLILLCSSLLQLLLTQLMKNSSKPEGMDQTILYLTTGIWLTCLLVSGILFRVESIYSPNFKVGFLMWMFYAQFLLTVLVALHFYHIHPAIDIVIWILPSWMATIMYAINMLASFEIPIHRMLVRAVQVLISIQNYGFVVTIF